MSERENILRQILAKRRAVDTYLAYGDAADGERVRDEIADLERQLIALNEREHPAREKRRDENAGIGY